MNFLVLKVINEIESIDVGLQLVDLIRILVRMSTKTGVFCLYLSLMLLL